MGHTDEMARPCPDCGAALADRDLRCWLCGHEISDQEVKPLVSPRAAGRAPAWPVQFSLDTVFLATTLIAVCLGATLAAPGLGLLLVVVAVPAVIRTIVAGRQVRQADRAWTTVEKIAALLASFGITAAVITAGFAAFAAAVGTTFALCVTIAGGGDDPGPVGMVVVVGLLYASPVFGLAITAWLFWLSRPRTPRSRRPSIHPRSLTNGRDKDTIDG